MRRRFLYNRNMKKRILLFVIGLVILATAITLLGNDNTLGTTEYPYRSSRVPESFHGFRIAQVSDLHNDDLGDPDILTAAVRRARPDIIVITGDMVDANRLDIPVALDFAGRFSAIAPTYYINGNHDYVPQYSRLKQGLLDRGVTVLEDLSVRIESKKEFITLSGVVDPYIAEDLLVDRLARTLPRDGSFTILLSHRPERLEAYADAGADLVLTGHAHGGQMRFPLIGAVYAPHQGLFPAYTEGMHTMEQTTMVVSRGIGNSIFPLRVNNPPELVLIELQRP